MATAQIKAVITAEDRASETISKFGHGVGTVAKGVAVGVAVAGAAVAAFGVASVGAFMESEDAAAQLNAVLKSTGGVAGVTADQANALASALQKTTKYSDESILSAQNMLLTFTNIGKDVFPDVTRAVLDMSTAMGQDLKQTSIQVGKAMQDPIAGATALQRVGVKLTDTQKDLIKSLVESGDTMGAQKVILQELQKEFGGSAEAAGKTFGGQLEILKNTFGDLMEVIGKGIVDVIQPFVKAIADYVDNHQQQIADGFNGLAQGIGIAFSAVKWAYDNVLAPVFGYLQDRAPAILAALKEAWVVLGPALQTLWTVIRDNLWPALKDLWTALEPLAPYILGALVVGIYVLVSALTLTVAVLTIVVKFVTLVADAFGWLLNKANELGRAIGNVMTQIMIYAALWYSANKNAVDGVANAFRGLVWVLGAIGVGIYHSITGPFVAAYNVISAIIGNIRNDLGGFGVGMAARIGIGILGRASGGPVSANSPYIVGEKGPELFVPSGSGTIIPNGQGSTAQTTSNTTININVGLMTGSAIERREAARMMFEDLKDIASMQGQTVNQMIGSN